MKRILWLLPFLALNAQADWHINNGQTSVIRMLTLYQSADPDAVITTVTSEDSGLTARFCDNAGTCTLYDASGEFQPIATNGTYAAPAANNLSIEHVAGGLYELHFADGLWDTAGASQGVFHISGAGVYPMSVEVFMDGIDSTGVQAAAAAALTAFDSANGVAKEQTLLALDVVADRIEEDTQGIQTSLSEGVTLEDAAITANKYDGSTAFAQTGDSFARLGAPAGASVSADIAAAQGVLDDITFTEAGEVDVNVKSFDDTEVCITPGGLVSTVLSGNC